MLPIEQIAAERPHLKDVLGLYEKVQEFIRLTAGLDRSGDIAYSAGSADAIFGIFSSVFDVPADMLEPLKEVMKLGRIDLTRLPMNEAPSFSFPYLEDEVFGVLFLISKPFFLNLRESLRLPAMFWEEGRCPVCHSVPSIASIKQDEGRTFYCSFCEASGRWHRIGCPGCLNRDGSKIDILQAENEKGLRVELCGLCRNYIKTADAVLLHEYTPQLLDIISIPLDVLAQNRSYRRLSPNPVGLIRIV